MDPISRTLLCFGWRRVQLMFVNVCVSERVCVCVCQSFGHDSAHGIDCHAAAWRPCERARMTITSLRFALARDIYPFTYVCAKFGNNTHTHTSASEIICEIMPAYPSDWCERDRHCVADQLNNSPTERDNYSQTANRLH